jgi:hypothetical protein
MGVAEPIDFASLMEPVARRLLGEPNHRLSKPPKDVRFGNHGSMSVDIEAGCFYDHEAEVGGGVVDLVRHKRQCDHPSAITWLRREGYFDTAFGPRPQHTAGRSRERFICGYD